MKITPETREIFNIVLLTCIFSDGTMVFLCYFEHCQQTGKAHPPISYARRE